MTAEELAAIRLEAEGSSADPWSPAVVRALLAYIAALEREVAEAREAAARVREGAAARHLEIQSLRQRAEEAERQLREVREYARHAEGCSGEFEGRRCRCGFSEVSHA